MDKFEIPLVIKGKKIGIIEIIVINDEGDFPEILFSGILLHKLEKPKVLVKLLQKEGIHLGKH